MLGTKSASRTAKAAVPAAPFRAGRRVCRALCQAGPSSTPSRRDVLLTGSAVVASPLILAAPAPAAEKLMPVSSLGTFQKAAQRDELVKRATKVLREEFTSADATGCMALLLHDAGTYDPVSKTGGVDGSIVLSSEELGRPENASLKPLVERLRKAKEAIDAARPEGQAPLSWADLLVLAAKSTTQQVWREIKLGRAQTESGGKLIADAYGAEWQVRLGRLDSSEAGPAGRVPVVGASTEEVKAFMKQLGAKPDAGSGPFSPRPPFWERPLLAIWPAAQADPLAAEAQLVADDPAGFKGAKADYDRSRQTLTRTDYEVEFINAFSKLADIGAKFQPDAYLYPEKTLALRF